MNRFILYDIIIKTRCLIVQKQYMVQIDSLAKDQNIWRNSWVEKNKLRSNQAVVDAEIKSLLFLNNMLVAYKGDCLLKYKNGTLNMDISGKVNK